MTGRYSITSGEIFGFWTVVQEIEQRIVSGHKKRMILCECICGVRRVICISQLRSGHSKSCGCKKRRSRVKQLESGKRFGRLTVIRELEPRRKPDGRDERWVLCQCDCGAEHSARWVALRHGHTQSCGCLNRDVNLSIEHADMHFVHGHARNGMVSSTYTIWLGMHERCAIMDGGIPKNRRYGGRGIKVCSRWNSFENFFSDMGEKPEGKSLDRINNDLGYSPENCRWATPTQQARNTRRTTKVEVDGVKMSARDFAETMGVNPDIFTRRVQRGWTIDRALNTPIARRVFDDVRSQHHPHGLFQAIWGYLLPEVSGG